MLLHQSQIDQQLKQLNFQSRAFINGQSVAAQSGKTFASVSPIDGRKLIDVAQCDIHDVNSAVKYAKNAFEQGVWRKKSPSERKKILLKFADLLEKHALELALLDTLNMGKPIKDTYTIDLQVAIDSTRWYAEAIDKLYDEIAPTGSEALALITHEPYGVVVGISPWNFPLMLGVGKWVQGLITGNSVILKPAEQSPLSVLRAAELLAEAGVPEGVFAVLPGFGDVGEALARHVDVDLVSFTGSTEVGKLLLKYSAESNMKKVTLECGGKSPNIVFADCENLTRAAEGVAHNIFFNQGEVCCAGTRLIVDEKIQEPFLALLKKEAKKWLPGDPLNLNTVMGAIVDETQYHRVISYIELGKKEGAKLLCGGEVNSKNQTGYYVEPTIFTDVQMHMKIAKEEIFGPVLVTSTFKNQAEAIHLANHTDYGLAAYVWTDNINTAHQTAREIRAGSIAVNGTCCGNVMTPFGGFKQSGIDREKSLHGLRQYSQMKTTWITFR